MDEFMSDEECAEPPPKLAREKKEPSPHSSKDRKRRKDENFAEILDKKTVLKVRCLKCSKLLSSAPGRHQTVHRNGSCLATSNTPKRRLSSDQKKSLNDSIVSYLLESGSSFNHLQSKSFRKLIRKTVISVSPGLDMSSIQLPSAEWIKSQAELKYEELIKNITNDIQTPVRQGEACLVLDFGRKWHDFLSVFLVYIDKRLPSPQLKVTPFAFAPIFESKKTENIVRNLVDAGIKFQLTEEEILALRIVGDGARNIQKLAQYFKSSAVCACHTVQKAAERVLNPLKESQKSMTTPELDHLQSLSDAVDICGSIASRLRRLKDKGTLSRLPTNFCPTRWLTFLYCTRDVLQLYSEIEAVTDDTIQSLLLDLEPERPKIITLIGLVDKFEHPLKRFEETKVKVHEVAPVMFSLLDYFREEQKKGANGKDYTRETVSKSAVLSLEHYIQETVGDVHLISTFLCVGLKSLSTIPAARRDSTIKLVMDELEKIDSSLPPQNTSTASSSSYMDKFYDAPAPMSSAKNELEDYQRMTMSLEERDLCPLQFWDRHSSRFPRLSKLANSVFCVLSSESICERAFSHLNKVFRPDRFNTEPELVEKLMISYIYLNNFM
ncbi:hypothetical protein B9Z55_017990 [Caenorhabditis nigoni]|uniref:HAT C-terminal dimerisation domain-containing protein n=1 Tax=Caenorhabditis nigoni TaxID=1611254 RepID=A0A2G5TBS0_9PELO|nr:hypothetical protein B9Z55_017990 [Caenorhabditis nigoni]